VGVFGPDRTSVTPRGGTPLRVCGSQIVLYEGPLT
jgi:hypothetical protein